jgi:hypothetical protein
MKPESAAKVKYGTWGLICGAVMAMMIGFAWGGWTTSGTTRTLTREAVLASQAAICVAQFMKQPNPEDKLKALADVSSYQRAEVIEKGGWDKMPGQEKADWAVARACADGLDLIKKWDWYVLNFADGGRLRTAQRRLTGYISHIVIHRTCNV